MSALSHDKFEARLMCLEAEAQDMLGAYSQSKLSMAPECMSKHVQVHA